MVHRLKDSVEIAESFYCVLEMMLAVSFKVQAWCPKNNTGGKREGEESQFMRSISKPTGRTDTHPQEPKAASSFSATTMCSNPERWAGSWEAASPSRPGWVLSHGYLHD